MIFMPFPCRSYSSCSTSRSRSLSCLVSVSFWLGRGRHAPKEPGSSPTSRPLQRAFPFFRLSAFPSSVSLSARHFVCPVSFWPSSSISFPQPNSPLVVVFVVFWVIISNLCYKIAILHFRAVFLLLPLLFPSCPS